MERDLRGAQQGGELRTVYQPIVAARDGRITGVEALLRWARPSGGLVVPAVVVPLAEQAGLITEIGGWVLEFSDRPPFSLAASFGLNCSCWCRGGVWINLEI